MLLVKFTTSLSNKRIIEQLLKEDLLAEKVEFMDYTPASEDEKYGKDQEES